MTSLSVLRCQGSQLLRSLQGCQGSLVRLTHTSNVDQAQKSSIPDRAESHGYTPFKVDFNQNKVEWALARVDDLVNWGRKASRNSILTLPSHFSLSRDLCGL